MAGRKCSKCKQELGVPHVADEVHFVNFSSARVASTQLNELPQYFGKDLEAMSFATNYHNWILAEIAPYLGECVAEVGAGVGSFSTLLLTKKIHKLVAFEPSQNMFPLLKNAIGADKRVTTINKFFGRDSLTEKFDSILYINVLEHVEDDVSELSRAREALTPNGHLIIFVPALPWLYGNLDRSVGHFRRYLKKDLVNITARVGLSIVDARYFDIAGVIPWYVNFVLLKNEISGGSVTLYDRLVVPVMRKIERVLPVPIGKNVLLIAKNA